MKVIKKINNNVAVCLDNNDHELIAFGKGIGFPKMPYVLENLAGIDRTFYGINDSYFELIQEIPEEIIELTARIVDIARNYLNYNLNDNITFTLADHINFAIDRQKKKMVFNYPMAHDLQYFYQQEMEMGGDCGQYDCQRAAYFSAKERSSEHCGAFNECKSSR